MSQETPYFKAYEDLQVHNLMLRDEARTSAYRRAILNNASIFKDKIVMDIGAGTGILSLFCAQAGAKLVYAVEAAPKLIEILLKTVSANKFSNVITVIEAEVENLPDHIKPESVDVIVSEWMGFFLLHEGMLESVLSARQYLKKEGLMFPDKCIIQAALCELPEFFGWNEFHGLNLSDFGQHLRAASQHEPQIRSLKKEQLISEPIDLFSFNVKSVDENFIQRLNEKFVVPASREAKYQGLCIWFKVFFPTTSKNDMYELDTSPFSLETHWKQSIIVFNEEIPLEEQEPVGFELIMQKNGSRTYSIEFSHCEADSIPHSTPCNCYEIKCRIVKAYVIDENRTGEMI